MTTGPTIRLPIHPQDVASAERFAETLARARSETAHLVKALRDVSQILKGAQFSRIGRSVDSLNNYMAGYQARTQRRTDRIEWEGTRVGQSLENARAELDLARRSVQLTEQKKILEAARNVNLREQARHITKINDLEQATTKLEATRVRLGMALRDGKNNEVRSAQRIIGVLESHIQKLKAQNAERERAARLAEREARAAERAAAMRPQRMAQVRADTRERLFGDGGASLFTIQAGLGANYMILNALRNSISGSIQFTVQLDESLRNLQAITVTTDENMKKLRETVVGIAEDTRFFATEVADAAVILGQAGFSTQEIEESLRAVALLATATGTDLKSAVDIATSVIGVFEMEASQMAGVANTLTAAVNRSKVDIEKLTLGLQYAGNTASQAGVSFEELTAAFGAMANAGIRSGSTLGTGTRQILISLTKPSEEFKRTLDRLGISMADVDLRANGLYGAMMNLREGGFTAADAIRSFEVRAAAAFTALSSNLDEMVRLERAFLNNSAAMDANETQMRSFINQGRRFGSALSVLVSEGMQPLATLVRDLLDIGADFLEWMRNWSGAIQVATTFAVSLGAAWATVRVALLGLGLARIAAEMWGLTAATTAMSGATTAAAWSVRGLTAALVASPAGLAILAGSLITTGLAYLSFRSEVEKAETTVARAQTAFDDASGSVDQTRNKIDMVSARIQELSDRSQMLSRNQNLLNLEIDRAREQFRGMGVQIGDNVDTVDELITSLKNLKQSLSEEYVLRINTAGAAMGALIEAQQGVIDQGLQQARNLPDLRHRGRIFSWQAIPSRNNDFVDYIDRVRNLDPSDIDGLHALRAEGQALDIRIDNPGDPMSQLGRRHREILRDAQEAVEMILTTSERVNSLQLQQTDLLEEQAIQANRLLNADLMSRVDAFRPRAQVQEAAQAAGGPVEAFEAARLAYAAAQAQAGDLKAALRSDPNLRSDVVESEVQRIENILAEAAHYVSELADAAGDVVASQRQMVDLRAQLDQEDLQRRLAEVRTAEEAQALLSPLNSLARERFEAAERELGIKMEPGSEAYDLQRRALQAELRQETENNARLVADRIGEIIEGQIDVLKLLVTEQDNHIESLRQQLDGMAAGPDRDRVVDRLLEAQAVRSGLARQIIETGEGSATEKALALRQEELALTQTLARIEQERENVNRRAAEERERALAAERNDLMAAQDIVDQVDQRRLDDLMGTARSNEEIKTLQAQLEDMALGRLETMMGRLQDQWNRGEISEERFNAEAQKVLQDHDARLGAISTAAARQTQTLIDEQIQAIEVLRAATDAKIAELEWRMENAQPGPDQDWVAFQLSQALNQRSGYNRRILGLQGGPTLDSSLRQEELNLMRQLEAVEERRSAHARELAAIQKRGREQAEDTLLTLRRQRIEQALIAAFGEDSVVVAWHRHTAELAIQKAQIETLNITDELKALLWESVAAQNQFAAGSMSGPIEVAVAAARTLVGVLQQAVSLAGQASAIASGVSGILQIRNYARESGGFLAAGRRFIGNLTGGRIFGSTLAPRQAAPPRGRPQGFGIDMDGDGIPDHVNEIWDREAARGSRGGGGGRGGGGRSGREGGGGGSSGKPEDPVRQWFEMARDRVQGLRSLIENDLIDGPRGLAGIDAILDAAREKIKAVEQELSGLQQAMLDGTLTEAQQERLNDLLTQHRDLTGMIRENEEEILHLRLEQGDVMGTLRGLLKSFAAENLNMSRTILSGMTDVFSNLKSGMTEFFTSWSQGTKSGKEAFRDFGVTILKTLNEVFAQMMTVYLLQKAMGWMFPGMDFKWGKGGGDVISGILGFFTRKAGGGRVQGRLNRDSEPHLLMEGEYVLRRSAAQTIGYDELDRINAMGNRVASRTQHHGVAQQQARTPPGNINVYLVDERSRAPALGPHDVLAIVNDDLARGGPTKRLVKSIQMGSL